MAPLGIWGGGGWRGRDSTPSARQSRSSSPPIVDDDALPIGARPRTAQSQSLKPTSVTSIWSPEGGAYTRQASHNTKLRSPHQPGDPPPLHSGGYGGAYAAAGGPYASYGTYGQALQQPQQQQQQGRVVPAWKDRVAKEAGGGTQERWPKQQPWQPQQHPAQHWAGSSAGVAPWQQPKDAPWQPPAAGGGGRGRGGRGGGRWKRGGGSSGAQAAPLTGIEYELSQLWREELIQRCKMVRKLGVEPIQGRGCDPARYEDQDLRAYLLEAEGQLRGQHAGSRSRSPRRMAQMAADSNLKMELVAMVKATDSEKWHEFATVAWGKFDPVLYPCDVLQRYLDGLDPPTIEDLCSGDLEEMSKADLGIRCKMAVKQGATAIMGQGRDPERYSQEQLIEYLQGLLNPDDGSEAKSTAGEDDGSAKEKKKKKKGDALLKEEVEEEEEEDPALGAYVHLLKP